MLIELTGEQREEIVRALGIVMAKVRGEVAAMAEMTVLKSNGVFLGETQFVLRDRCHTTGSHVLDAALEERKGRQECLPHGQWHRDLSLSA